MTCCFNVIVALNALRYITLTLDICERYPLVFKSPTQNHHVCFKRPQQFFNTSDIYFHFCTDTLSDPNCSQRRQKLCQIACCLPYRVFSFIRSTLEIHDFKPPGRVEAFFPPFISSCKMTDALRRVLHFNPSQMDSFVQGLDKRNYTLVVCPLGTRYGL